MHVATQKSIDGMLIEYIVCILAYISLRPNSVFLILFFIQVVCVCRNRNAEWHLLYSNIRIGFCEEQLHNITFNKCTQFTYLLFDKKRLLLFFYRFCMWLHFYYCLFEDRMWTKMLSFFFLVAWSYAASCCCLNQWRSSLFSFSSQCRQKVNLYLLCHSDHFSGKNRYVYWIQAKGKMNDVFFSYGRCRRDCCVPKKIYIFYFCFFDSFVSLTSVHKNVASGQLFKRHIYRQLLRLFFRLLCSSLSGHRHLHL